MFQAVFEAVRRVIVFGLGCWTIANALVNPEERLGQLIVGMVLVGILPVENITSWFGRRGGDDSRRPSSD